MICKLTVATLKTVAAANKNRFKLASAIRSEVGKLAKTASFLSQSSPALIGRITIILKQFSKFIKIKRVGYI